MSPNRPTNGDRTHLQVFMDGLVGRGLNSRDRAARTLAWMLGTAVILMVLAGVASGIRNGLGITDDATQLLIGVLTLLVGTVSGYLARRQDQGADEGRAPVGTILSAALGSAMIVIAGAAAYMAIFDASPELSSNMATLMSAVIGGSLGAASAYLGLPRPENPEGQTLPATALLPRSDEAVAPATPSALPSSPSTPSVVTETTITETRWPPPQGAPKAVQLDPKTPSPEPEGSPGTRGDTGPGLG